MPQPATVCATSKRRVVCAAAAVAAAGPGPRQLAIGIATALKVRLQPAGTCTVGKQGILINDFRKESIRIPSGAGFNRVAHTLSCNLQLAACHCCKLNPVLSSLAQLCDTCGSITAQKNDFVYHCAQICIETRLAPATRSSDSQADTL